MRILFYGFIIFIVCGCHRFGEERWVRWEDPPVPPDERVPADPITPSSRIWPFEKNSQVWVIIVGISQYEIVAVPDTPFAKKDAHTVRDWFVHQGKLPEANVHMLLNEQATRENLLGQIDWMRKQALAKDAIFVYFAGHGAPELAKDGSCIDGKYLVLYDTDPKKLFSTGFSFDDLTNYLDKVKAETQVVLLEACYSGPVGQEILAKTPTADLEIRPRSIRKMGKRAGRTILTASSSRQMAIASDELKGSLFTQYLIRSWGDGTRPLLSECFEDAQDTVQRAANSLGSTQIPAKYGDVNIDIILQRN